MFTIATTMRFFLSIEESTLRNLNAKKKFGGCAKDDNKSYYTQLKMTCTLRLFDHMYLSGLGIFLYFFKPPSTLAQSIWSSMPAF